MSDIIRLFIDSNFSSPYAMFAYIALKEKRIPFTLKNVDLSANTHQSGAYQQLSLTSRVPTLERGSFALSESSAIIEYLEEAFPAPGFPPLFPAGIEQKARTRQLQAWLRSDLLPLREERPTTVIFRAPSSSPLSPAAQESARKLLHAAGSLINAQGDNIFGAWCIADTELALMLNRLVANSDPVPAPLRAYVERQWQRPSVQSWLKHEQG